MITETTYSGNTPVYVWPHTIGGVVIGEIHRVAQAGGRKADIPHYIKDGKGFKEGIPDRIKALPYPLFGLDSIFDPTCAVIVCEGQKVQYAWWSLGYQAVTSLLGGRSAHLSDWTALRGHKEVWFALDNDETGEQYGEAVWGILRRQDPEMIFKVIRFPNLPHKGDLCDHLKTYQELADWNELDPLDEHPQLEGIQERLNAVMDLTDVPTAWQALVEWSKPKEIGTEMRPVPPMEPDMIPPAFRPWARDVSKRASCAIEFVSVGLVIALASIIGRGCSIRPKIRDNWTVIPNLWGMAVARPGSMKSFALGQAKEPLSKLEAKAQEQHVKQMQRYKVESDLYKGRVERLKSEARNKLQENDLQKLTSEMLQLQDQEPEKPARKRFVANDSTIEKLVELLEENPRGLLVFRDELSAWLNSLEKPGRESDRQFFLESWPGDIFHNDDRITRGTHGAWLCLSILGGIQREKLEKYMYSCMYGENDGLMQRFQLMVYPDDNLEASGWVDEYADDEARAKVFRIVEDLAVMDFTTTGAQSLDGVQIPFFHFTASAYHIAADWFVNLEARIRQEPISIIQEHLSKYRSLMPSLALIFHLTDIADGTAQGNVSESATRLAIRWCEFLEQHARRIYGLVADRGTKATSILAAKLMKGELQDGFSVRDIHRKQWSFLADTVVIKNACDDLIDAGWLLERRTTPRFQQKMKITYLINPKLRNPIFLGEMPQTEPDSLDVVGGE